MSCIVFESYFMSCHFSYIVCEQIRGFSNGSLVCTSRTALTRQPRLSRASAATDSVIDHWISPSGSRPAAELYLIGCWFLNYPRGGFGGRIWVSFSILSATHLRVFMLTIKTKLFYFNNKECFCSAVEPMSVGADWNCPLVQVQVWIFVLVHCGFT